MIGQDHDARNYIQYGMQLGVISWRVFLLFPPPITHASRAVGSVEGLPKLTRKDWIRPLVTQMDMYGEK